MSAFLQNLMIVSPGLLALALVLFARLADRPTRKIEVAEWTPELTKEGLFDVGEGSGQIKRQSNSQMPDLGAVKDEKDHDFEFVGVCIVGD